MKIRRFGLFFVFCLAALPAAARPMVALTGDKRLFKFDSATPGTLTSPALAITGLLPGDEIRGIDFRPASGVLYALAINNTAGADTGRIYTIDLTTAVATPVGASPFSTALAENVAYGFDFDPVSGQIRVVNSGDQNLRVDPDTGALAGTDAPLESANNAFVVGAAYDRSDRKPATASTLFGIDSNNDLLVRIGGVDQNPSPNGGEVTTIGAMGVHPFGGTMGFDIAEDGTAYISAPQICGFASICYSLRTINLSTGTATYVDSIGPGNIEIRGLAAVPTAVTNIDSGEFFATIQAAIDDAQTLNGHTIAVNAGTFNELVTVNKSLTLLGAKSGVDARAAGRGTLEAMVRGVPTSEGRTSGFNVTVDGVTIDGFTVQNTGDESLITAAIVLAPNIAGSRIRNNIIRNNISGLIASNDTQSNHLIIERNLFANNADTGISTHQSLAGPIFVSALIDNNTFDGNTNGAVALGSTASGSQSNIGITNNIISGNGNGVILFNTVDSFVTGNTITNSTDSQVALGGGVNRLYVSENIIDGGASRGIRIGIFFNGGSPNRNIVIGCNVITNNSTAGLEIDPNGATASYTGTLVAQNNWWGDASGPMIASNPDGLGQKLIDPATQVLFKPFLHSGNDNQAAKAGFQCYAPPVLYGINQADKTLIRFQSDNLGTVTSIPITGLVGMDFIIGLDFEFDTGLLYGLSNGNRLYTINPHTGVATHVNLAPFTLSGLAFGFDVNTSSDQIRVISDSGQNLRLDPGFGEFYVDTTLAYASGDPSFGLNADCSGAAYLINSFSNASSITLYNIDTAQDALVTQGSINGSPSTSEEGLLFTVGKLGINPTDDNTKVNTSFDISRPVGGVNVPLAALTTNGTSSHLYDINLVTGAATSRGIIGGASPLLVRALAAAPVGTLDFIASGRIALESASGVNITIFRQNGSEGTVTVEFTTTDGTATGGVDYTDSDQVVTFASGETSKVVQIPLTDDSIIEPDETVLLALKNPTGGAFLGFQTTIVLTIRNNDLPPPTFTTQASQSGALGEAVFDTATISGTAPGGTITFRLFGPNDATCSGAPIFTSTVNVNGNGTYTSASFTPTTPGAYYWVASYSGDGVNNGPVSSTCGAPNQSITVADTVLGNIATRLRVETGDNVLIAGFIITGTQPKKVIVRGIGSSLDLADKLADPTLELRDATGALLDSNDNWVDSPNIQAIYDSTIPPSNDLESAIVASLPANNSGYTAILRGANNGTGLGVVEAYDLDRVVDSELANISTRGFVSTGDNVLIAGTIVVGGTTQRVIIRAIGPSLNLPGQMADPTLELRDGNGLTVEYNDNWMDSPNKQAIIDSTIPPSNDLESAIVATLDGNNSGYTAIVRGANGTTGIAVVEIYALP